MSVMSGRDLVDAATLRQDLTLEGDVVIIGTGAGGGISAEVLSAAGLKVIMVEAGAYHTAATFSQNEAEATAMLYQKGGAQRSKDKGIVLLQGRSVGGATTVNWTTSIRTPPETLAHWRDRHALSVFSEAEMAPYFAEVEARLSMHQWREYPPNENNAILARGCGALGLEWHVIARNVKGCANSGLCGLGCPINAKQSQMVTSIPAALDMGATLISKARALRLRHDHGRISALEVAALDATTTHETGIRITLRARHFIAAASAIRSPALLLRSNAPDPSGLLGKRTFLHPVVAVAGEYPQRVEGFYGAPQSVNSHAFLWPDGQAANGALGFKLETIPTSLMLAAAFFDKAIGADHARRMHALAHLAVIDALLRDGFNDFEPGGTVGLDESGSAVLDYPLSDFLTEGARKVIGHVFDIHFAAGARNVSPWHVDNPRFDNPDSARRWLENADLGRLKGGYGSAHTMGGCQMGRDERHGVVDMQGRHFGLENLSVHDASIFPSSIGVNPQLSVYATSLRNSRKLAKSLN